MKWWKIGFPVALIAWLAAITGAMAQNHPPAGSVSEAEELFDGELDIPFKLRVMVVAPHPDDETIAAGGLIQQVLENRGQVRVVFATNGDGFRDGVRCDTDHYQLSARDFLEYGKQRQEEALQALQQLKLTPEDAVFLGFPDDGIDDLWAGYWSRQKPYLSPHTHSDRPPYRDILSPWARYAGADLLHAIMLALRDFRPNWIVMPDPRDTHPDHCTTGVFVLDALRKLREQRDVFFNTTQVFTYLVHYLDYPSAHGWLTRIAGVGVGGYSTGGGMLAKTQWLKLPLTSEEQFVKREALLAHESQVEALYDFLRPFLRDYELFGRIDPVRSLTVPIEYAARCGRRSS